MRKRRKLEKGSELEVSLPLHVVRIAWKRRFVILIT